MATNVVIINQKGGVGKTTTAQNLAVGLAEIGNNVLVVDCDQQCNLTVGCGVIIEAKQPTLIDVLRGLVTAEEAILPLLAGDSPLRKGGCVSLLPASEQLSVFGQVVADEVGKEYLLKEALESVQPAYDFIIFDCPPSLDLMAWNTLVASNFALIPVQVEGYALQGVASFITNIGRVQKRLNPALRIAGIIPTMVDMRRNLTKDVLNALEQNFQSLIFKTTIRTAVTIAEAPSHGESIFTYDPKGNGAKDYADLTKEFVQKLKSLKQEG